jgi:hypothetical protein
MVVFVYWFLFIFSLFWPLLQIIWYPRCMKSTEYRDVQVSTEMSWYQVPRCLGFSGNTLIQTTKQHSKSLLSSSFQQWANVNFAYRYWPGHLGTRYWTVRDLDETIFLTDHNCLVLINCQYFCTSSSLIYRDVQVSTEMSRIQTGGFTMWPVFTVAAQIMQHW